MELCRRHSGTRLGTNGSTSQTGDWGQGALGVVLAAKVVMAEERAVAVVTAERAGAVMLVTNRRNGSEYRSRRTSRSCRLPDQRTPVSPPSR